MGTSQSNLPAKVVKDGNGKYLRDYKVREFLGKIKEEEMEFEAEILKYHNLDSVPTCLDEPNDEIKMAIAGEACDIITSVYNACRHMFISDSMMEAAMSNTIEKVKSRGYTSY